MTISTPADRIELAELSTLIPSGRKYSAEQVDHAVKFGSSLKAVKKRLAMGKSQMYALKDKHCNVITNMKEIVTVTEELNRDLCSSRYSQNNIERGSRAEEIGIPPIRTEDINKALNGMQAGKAPGENQITADLWKDCGQIVLKKLSKMYTQCLMTASIPES